MSVANLADLQDVRNSWWREEEPVTRLGLKQLEPKPVGYATICGCSTRNGRRVSSKLLNIPQLITTSTCSPFFLRTLHKQLCPPRMNDPKVQKAMEDAAKKTGKDAMSALQDPEVALFRSSPEGIRRVFAKKTSEVQKQIMETCKEKFPKYADQAKTCLRWNKLWLLTFFRGVFFFFFFQRLLMLMRLIIGKCGTSFFLNQRLWQEDCGVLQWPRGRQVGLSSILEKQSKAQSVDLVTLAGSSSSQEAAQQNGTTWNRKCVEWPHSGILPWLAPMSWRQVVLWWRKLSRVLRASASCASWVAAPPLSTPSWSWSTSAMHLGETVAVRIRLWLNMAATANCATLQNRPDLL